MAARYHDDGTLDTTFGRQGLLELGPYVHGWGKWGAAVAPDGKLVLAGSDGRNFVPQRLDES